MSFAALADEALRRLADQRLIDYVRAARDAGELPAARRALMLLVYGYAPDVRRRLSLRVPPQALDDLTQEVLVKAIAAAFDGSSIGELRCWLTTILERTAADYHRRASRRPLEVALPGEQTEEGEWSAAEPSVAPETGEVELRMVVEQVLSGFSERHRQVIELHVFEGLQAREVCERIDSMREDNVAQVASRFRRRLREALQAGGGRALAAEAGDG